MPTEKHFNAGSSARPGEVTDIHEDDAERPIKITTLGAKDGSKVSGCMDELFTPSCVYDMDRKTATDVVPLPHKNSHITYKHNGELSIIHELCGFRLKTYLDPSVPGSTYTSNAYTSVNPELRCRGLFDPA